ncbi:MAG: PAS domain-containing protein, partial [Leptolyngbya sp. SIO3F4]|nr:PAS domain-containing protein [Leptolyngbya sp. SIO3F4]
MSTTDHRRIASSAAHADPRTPEDAERLIALLRAENDALRAQNESLLHTSHDGAAPANERFYRGVLDGQSAHIAVLDQHGQIVATNQAWRRFWRENGGAADAEATMNYLAVCDQAAGSGECGESAARVADAIRRVSRGESEVETWLYDCHSPDREAWYNAVVTPSGAGDGGVVVAHFDVSSLVRTQRDLQTVTGEHERLALIARHTNAAAAVADALGRIEWINESFARLTGYELDEVRGSTLTSLLRGPETRPTDLDALREAVITGRGVDLECQLYTRGANPFWAEVELRAIRAGDGKV